MQTHQTTLERRVFFEGKGVHSGEICRMSLRPAEADTGYLFARADLGRPEGLLPARFDAVGETLLGTNLTNEFGVSIATVEHILSALYGLGVDNAIIEVDAGEIPIADGSSAVFAELIEAAGLFELDETRRFLQVLKPVEIVDGDKRARFDPADEMRLTLTIDFQSTAIGRQVKDLVLTPEAYRREIASARTFGFLHEAEQLRASGRALGAGLDNTIVIDGDRVMNAEPLRFEDEFVRHKLLDAVGDFSLVGGVILGHFTGERTGHGMNNRLLRALFADESAYAWVQKPG